MRYIQTFNLFEGSYRFSLDPGISEEELELIASYLKKMQANGCKGSLLYYPRWSQTEDEIISIRIVDVPSATKIGRRAKAAMLRKRRSEEYDWLVIDREYLKQTSPQNLKYTIRHELVHYWQQFKNSNKWRGNLSVSQEIKNHLEPMKSSKISKAELVPDVQKYIELGEEMSQEEIRDTVSYYLSPKEIHAHFLQLYDYFEDSIKDNPEEIERYRELISKGNLQEIYYPSNDEKRLLKIDPMIKGIFMCYFGRDFPVGHPYEKMNWRFGLLKKYLVEEYPRIYKGFLSTLYKLIHGERIEGVFNRPIRIEFDSEDLKNCVLDN